MRSGRVGTTADRTFAVLGPGPLPGSGADGANRRWPRPWLRRPSQPPPYAGGVSALGDDNPRELVVAGDGSIPADQLRKLGLLPGAHLRVVEAAVVPSGGRLAGSLPEFADLAWEDFERGSELARRDAEASCG